MHPCCSLHSCHPLSLVPHPGPWVCPLCLHLQCCYVNRFVRPILLDSMFFFFWLTSCLICSRFIPFFRTDSNVFLFMAAFHPGSDCSLAMFWGRVMEPLCSISVWASSLSAHSRAASGWALWGLRAWGCPLFPGGSFVSSGPSGLGLWGHGAASRLRGAGLPLCPPAGRRCNRRKWGWSRRFLCPAERWPEVHLRALGGEGAWGEFHVQMAGFQFDFCLMA